MKKTLVFLIFISFSSSAWGFYDFCESPADYNTFPQAYDFRTEYWKDIPDYKPDDIKYTDMENEHPIFPIKMKKTDKNKDKNKNDSK